MEKLKNILNEIVKDYGLKILEDPQKFKAIFADYAKSEYSAEKELFTKLIETKAAKEIINAEDIQIIKNALIKKMFVKYFIDEKTCSNYIDIFISLLRNDYIPIKETTQTENHNIISIENEESKKMTNELPISNIHNPNEINNFQKKRSDEKFVFIFIFSLLFFAGFIVNTRSFIIELNQYGFSFESFIIAILAIFFLIMGIWFMIISKKIKKRS